MQTKLCSITGHGQVGTDLWSRNWGALLWDSVKVEGFSLTPDKALVPSFFCNFHPYKL